jgi:Flp pilus assembly protein TadG
VIAPVTLPRLPVARAVRARRRLRSQHGQVAIEFLGTVFLVLIAAMVAWELALVGWSAVGAANAARTAARAFSRTGDTASAEADGRAALQDDWLGAGSSVTVNGGKATVVVSVPLVIPGLTSPLRLPAATASMPHTG